MYATIDDCTEQIGTEVIAMFMRTSDAGHVGRRLRSPIREGVERTPQLNRWLLGTFTEVGNAVLDCFAGCGGMVQQCGNLKRHCVSVEVDATVFRSCIWPLATLDVELGPELFFGYVFAAVQWEREERASAMYRSSQGVCPLSPLASPSAQHVISRPRGRAGDPITGEPITGHAVQVTCFHVMEPSPIEIFV
ncbi:hypothetical protein L7F22_033862 [Adiantum nelumboides]|nr:hypothetical protein [Adiantum nelumboides]